MRCFAPRSCEPPSTWLWHAISRSSGRWPDTDPLRLAYAATYLVPVIQMPPRGLWRSGGAPTWQTAPEPGVPHDPRAAVEELVLRYLAAFGPATVNDAQIWSGLTRLREITERLDLRHYRTEEGADLLDLPDAPCPGPEVQAPPRFLPEYDNLLLSHADRSRVIPHDREVPLLPGNGASAGTVLIDGEWNAMWKLTRDGDAATITVTPFVSVNAATREALTAEAMDLLGFLAPAATPDVQITR